MPTVYIRQDNYDNIVKLKKNPTQYINEVLDNIFVKKVEYNPIQTIIGKDENKPIAKSENKPIAKKVTKKSD